MNHATHTAADAERWLRDLQRDPAVKGYGDHLRRKGILGPVPAPGPVPDEREMRRAMAERFRL